VAVLIAVTALNLIGTFQSKRTQIVFTALTLIAVLVVVAVGLFASLPPRPVSAVGETATGSAGLAMVFILLTYGGWNEAAYLSGEMRDVQRNMVRTLVLGVGLVILLYAVVNFAYLNVFGLEGVRQSNAIAADLMKMIVGERGALLLSLIVCIAALSTLNGTIFTGARIYYALGRDLGLLRALGAWEARGDKPANALLLQAAIALALIGFGAVTRDGFEAMVAYTAPVFWFFLFLVGASIYVFRRREPQRALPFRVPLYPVTPAVFCLTCAWMFYSALVYAGPGALIGIFVLLAGLPLLLLRRWTKAKAQAAQ
jgi:amino acid transporter